MKKQRWCYKVHVFEDYDGPLSKEYILGTLGTEGWELVQIFLEDDKHCAYLKKPDLSWHEDDEDDEDGNSDLEE